jgi:hypothetical protein
MNWEMEVSIGEITPHLPDFTLVFIHYVCQGVNRSHLKWLLK